MKRLLPVLAFAGILLAACENELAPATKTAFLDLPAAPYNYGEFVNASEATLGRALFYDRQLSVNNSLSCASCHKQSLAFTDNARFSKGFGGKLTTRNSMPIQNLGLSDIISIDSFMGDSTNKIAPIFQKALFWDGRENMLPTMVLRPIVNHVEMGITDLTGLEKKLQSIEYYPALFKDAYGSEEITIDRVGSALSTFLTTINANQTKLDRSMRGEEPLAPEELKGQELFFTKYDCNSCHQVGSPNGYVIAGTFANIGLDLEYEDAGLALVTKNVSDAGKFKIPSLRNVELTAPYMHDGRFKTLDEVMDHYSEGIADNPNLDSRLRTSEGKPSQFHIPDSDRKAIVAFLKTLTDHAMITDARFSDPFKTK